MCELSREVIDDILAQGRIYEVGGAVRDRLLRLPVAPKDRDYLVTGIDYDRLTGMLRKRGRVDLVGRSFGVIKFTQFRQDKSRTFDISLPRREYSTGWGHKDFEVNFDPALTVEDDLVRRDFTINAMALELDSEELIDPLGGRADLERRQIRMVYEKSFEDDPLRMLRAAQFMARFEFTVEPETLQAMRDHAAGIATVSAERINEELTKLLTLAEKPSLGFRLMHEVGLLREILPELENGVGVSQPGGYHKYDVFEHTLRVIDAARPALRLRLAALFHDVAKPQTRCLKDDGATFYGHEKVGARIALRALERLKFSRTLSAEVATLVERHMFTTDVTDKGLRRLVRRTGVDLIWDLLDLRRADVVGQGMGGSTDDVDEFETEINEELERRPAFQVTDLVIDGRVIMELLSIAPGPRVGQVLDHLLECVLDDPGLNEAETLKELARRYFETEIKTDDM